MGLCLFCGDLLSSCATSAGTKERKRTKILPAFEATLPTYDTDHEKCNEMVVRVAVGVDLLGDSS